MKISSLLFLATIFLACCGNKKNANTNITAPTAVYTNACCCNTTFNAGIGQIFIPSLFTPNNDGLNDLFRPIGSSNIKYILDVQISDATYNLLYTIDTAYGIPSPHSWDGYLNATTRHKGIMNIICQVIDNNNTPVNITAQSCSFICDTPVNLALPNITNCKLESMLDITTMGTPYASGESNCFQ